jgi:hypothetical protein
VLDRVLGRLRDAAMEPGPSPFVVFGLDGTLYDVRPRTLQILMEYADDVRDDHPEVADALGSLDVSRVQYLLSETLRGCGLTQAELVRDVTGYWRDRFHADEYCVHDMAAEGAADFVRACHEAGATVVYLSARDAPGMLLGTVASLRDHDFPVALPGVELVLKPDATMGDESFKRASYSSLARYGNVIGVFDNDAASCNLARSLFPEADVALVESVQVPGAPEPVDGVEPVSDFRFT